MLWATYGAKNRRKGMTAQELVDAIHRGAQAGMPILHKTRVGFRNQVLEITMREKELSDGQ